MSRIKQKRQELNSVEADIKEKQIYLDILKNSRERSHTDKSEQLQLRQGSTATPGISNQAANCRDQDGLAENTTPKCNKQLKFKQWSPRPPKKVSAVGSNTDKIVSVKHSAASERRRATVEAATNIHGQSVDNKPAKDGLWSSLAGVCTTEELKFYIEHSKRMKPVCQQLQHNSKKKLRDFEKSDENMVRSLKVMYKGGVLSKRKYSAIRSADFDNLSKMVPRMATYPNVVKYISAEVNQVPVKELQDVFGCVRDLEQLLLHLAEVYLQVPGITDVIEWFGRGEGSFIISVGADGYPFGKTDQGMSICVSVVNLVHKLASANHQYLLFGANCSEDHQVVTDYIQEDLLPAMLNIETKTYNVAEHKVTFAFEIFPCDHKMLAKLAGELSNAATYPCTFADIKKDQLSEIGRQWKPWNYTKRLEDAEKVKKMKEKSRGNPARTKVTQYIANTLHSRQEYVPLIRKYVDCLYPEPLHLKNNACQQLHEHVLQDVLAKEPSLVKKVNSTKELPPDCTLARYFHILKKVMMAGKLHFRLCNWFNEKRKAGKPVEVRFTGEDSTKFCHRFMYLLQLLLGDSPTDSVLFRVCILAYAGIKLRECIALFSQTRITAEDLKVLEESCRLYFNVNAIFLKVTLTIWIIGHTVPHYTRCMYEKYGYGLGLNSSQGLEAKHRKVKEYALKATKQNRWKLVFRHEDVHCIWLKEHDPKDEKYVLDSTELKDKDKILPSWLYTSEKYCYCGLTEPCPVCPSDIMKMVDESCKLGHVCEGLKKLKLTR